MERFVAFDFHEISNEKPFFETFVSESILKDFAKEQTLKLRMNQRTLDSEERKICAFGKLRKGSTEEQKVELYLRSIIFMNIFNNSKLE